MLLRARGVTHLSRRVFNIHRPINCRQYASSPNIEPYILPRLVIDLDDLDSQFVRQAEKKDYQTSYNRPHRRRLDSEFSKSTVEETGKATRPSEPFDLYAVTPPDLLRYALLGNPFASSGLDNASLRKVFSQHKIHPLDNADSKFKRLTFNFTTDSASMVEAMGFTPAHQQEIAGQLKRCFSINHLKRMVFAIASTVQGCQFLAEDASYLHAIKALHVKARQKGVSKECAADDVLRIINNFLLNMQSKGIKYDRQTYCGWDLHYACQAFHLTSVWKYLRLYERKFKFDAIILNSGSYLAFHPRRNVFSPLQAQRMSRLSQDRKLLRLLTGWQDNGVPKQNERRRPCFGARIDPLRQDRQGSFSMYILGLGSLEAKDALRHEWNRLQTHAWHTRSLLKKHDFNPNSQETIELFAMAFILAKDTDSAFITLETWFKQNPAAITKPTYTLSRQTRQTMLLYFKTNCMEPTHSFRSRLGTKTTSSTPQAILQTLEDLLIPEWFETPRKDYRSGAELPCLIDLIEQDGVEGIAVITRCDRQLVHFRPLSRFLDTSDAEGPSAAIVNKG